MVEEAERVVFIASCWRSGSTLLDMLLGANEGFCSLGELSKLQEFFRGDFGRSRCTCNEFYDECEFWSKVQTIVNEGDDAELILGRDLFAVTQDRKTMHRYVPSVFESVLLLGSRRLWDGAALFNRPASAGRQAARNTYRIIDAVARAAAAPVVVDSSKQPGQLKGLYMMDPERVRVIFMVRDGRANALSQAKAEGFSLTEAAGRWVRFNRNLEAVMATISSEKIHFIRYEDLCSDPDAVLRGICRFLDWPLTVDPATFRLAKNRYHIIGGNPMRFRQSEVSIRLDETWKKELTASNLQEIEAVLGRMNRRYGYE